MRGGNCVERGAWTVSRFKEGRTDGGGLAKKRGFFWGGGDTQCTPWFMVYILQITEPTSFVPEEGFRVPEKSMRKNLRQQAF